MAKQKYEYCEAAPARKSMDEAPAKFWSGVEREGLLIKALGG